jgi:hypothetical protein
VPRASRVPEGRRLQHCSFGAVMATLVMLAGTVGCKAVQVREHTRESYRAPTAPAPSVSRILSAQPDLVYQALFDWLIARSVAVEDADVEAGRIVADLRFSSDEAKVASVGMGSVRVVLTRTKREYLTYWPFEAGCDECIIRRGNLISSQTELIHDRVIPLDAQEYEIGALLRATVSGVPEGTRVELMVDLEVRPRSPPGIRPVSTGQLEEAVLEALEQALYP